VYVNSTTQDSMGAGEREIKVKVIENVEEYSKLRRRQLKEEFNLRPIVCFPNKFEYEGIVILKDMDFSTKCKHHGVSIEGRIHIAYIPNKTIIGLSQIPRLIEYYLNPTTEIIQEEVTKLIADKFEEILHPQGVFVILQANHDCMRQRGVKQRNAVCITSEIRGVFRDLDARLEVLRLLGYG